MRHVICLCLALSVVLACFSLGLGQTPDKEQSETKAQATEGKVDVKVVTKTEKPEEKAMPNPRVVIDTNYGDIVVELFQKEAPLSVANFLSYVRDGFYDGTVFHRVVKGFVLQAGGMDENLKQKKQMEPVKNEAINGLSNERGTLSMARTSAINSGTSHFFINLVDNTRLDHTGDTPATYGYAVFGRVVDGMDVVDKIAAVAVTNKGGMQNVPVKPVIIEKARVLEESKESKTKKAEEATAEKPKKESEEGVKAEQKKMKED